MIEPHVDKFLKDLRMKNELKSKLIENRKVQNSVASGLEPSVYNRAGTITSLQETERGGPMSY